MGRFGKVVVGLALLGGALVFAGYRLGFIQSDRNSVFQSAPQSATRSLAPPPTGGSELRSAAPAREKERSVSGFQLFEMGINVANVLVGALGIWMTMRGMRAEREAKSGRREA